MDVLIGGASGLIGQALVASLRLDGQNVRTLVRRDARNSEEIAWDPYADRIEWPEGYCPAAVICLSGAGIADKRWSKTYKRAIVESRIRTVSTLAKKLATLESPPSVFVTASAVGAYGAHRGDEELTETSARGDDFIGEVCRGWEEAAQPVFDVGIRTVHLRYGIVLADGAGALRKMQLPFTLGLGGHIGPGTQFMSWLTLDDAVGIAQFVLERDELSGPVNAVTPQPVTNREFAKTLAAALHRPAIFPLPAAVVKMTMGEMGRDLLLGSAKVMPDKLLKAGYTFQFPELKGAFERLLHS